MKAGMEILRPLLAETGAEPIGKVVIGTVKGDIHDIGKNLVAMMLEGAGFEVIDLGINNDVDKYLDALDEHQPDILGMSALLTTTMPYMKVVIDTMAERACATGYIVLVGGAPLNEEFGTAVGADAYCRDAAIAAETAKELVQARRAPPGRATGTVGRMTPTPTARDRVRRARPASCAAVLGQHVDGTIEVRYLPAHLHNRPERIVPAVEAIAARRSGERPGLRRLRRLRHRRRASTRCSPAIPASRRLPGAHCYEVFAGSARSPRCTTPSRARSSSPTSSPGTSTRSCGRALGLDRHPELLATYFGNYRRVVLLSPVRRRDVVVAGRPRPSGSASPSSTATSAAAGSPRRSRSPCTSRAADAARRAAARWSSSCGATSRPRSTPRSAASGTRCCCRDRFQRAIDRAKRKAKIRTAQEDVAQWRRISHPLDGDGPAAAAEAEAERLKTPTYSPGAARRSLRLRRRLGARPSTRAEGDDP